MLEGPGGAVHLEPLVMLVLLSLSRQAGQMVTRRQLFTACWGSAAVGDDSLNRTIALLRKALNQAAGKSVEVVTVPAAGYLLRLTAGVGPAQSDGDDARAEQVIEAAHRSWRLGIPEPDHLRLEQLRQLCRAAPDRAEAWGMLALLARYAAEYAGADASAEYVAECERSAAQALALDPDQQDARVALATVMPLFGRWLSAHSALSDISGQHPGCAPALHELAIVEMTTGRVREAKRLMDKLIEADPLAACFNYKSVWQNWSIGDIGRMDHVADRAVQLWPQHPAVWIARFWTLLYTGRPQAAQALIGERDRGPAFPEPMRNFLHLVASAVIRPDRSLVEQVMEASRTSARRGPAQAVAALLALGLFDAVDEAFALAYGYWAQAGEAPVPIRRPTEDASINDQHRRVTQPLFTPACRAMREDPRFPELCERLGLTAYWSASGRQPDFLVNA
nr:winged helix-turn-helix domain-containing protein [Sphingomonas sp. KRR8]